jgi:hypothetical protein
MSIFQIAAQNNATFARSVQLGMPGYALPLALSANAWFRMQLRSTLDPTQAAFQQVALTFDSRQGSIGVIAQDTTANIVTLGLLASAQAMAALDPAQTWYGDLVYVAGGNVAYFGTLEIAVSQGVTLGDLGSAPSYDSLASWPPPVDIAGTAPSTILSVQTQGLPGPIPWAPAAPWAANTVYRSAAPASLVTFGLSTWVCTTAHTSGTAFDPTKFLALVDATGVQAATNSAAGSANAAAESAANAASAALAAMSTLSPDVLATALVALIQSLPTQSTGAGPILWSDSGIPTYS